MEERVETIKLTEEMLLDILRGKHIHLILNAENPENKIEFRFRGPWDGMYLTHREISEIQYNAEMKLFKVIETIKKYKVDSKKT